MSPLRLIGIHQTITRLSVKVGSATVGLVMTALLALPTATDAAAQETQAVGPYKDFKGVIELDVRNSKPDWTPFLPKKAPEGAPNILFILYDDTGLAAWSPFGGRVNMPTLEQLANEGLRYTQWHTTALCSPTRSTILTVSKIFTSAAQTELHSS
jgi:Sulfatase